MGALHIVLRWGGKLIALCLAGRGYSPMWIHAEDTGWHPDVPLNCFSTLVFGTMAHWHPPRPTCFCPWLQNCRHMSSQQTFLCGFWRSSSGPPSKHLTDWTFSSALINPRLPYCLRQYAPKPTYLTIVSHSDSERAESHSFRTQSKHGGEWGDSGCLWENKTRVLRPRFL